MVFRKESVIERLKKLEAVLANLNEKAGFDFEEYRHNTDLQWIVERGLEVASSTILDLGNHILAGAFILTSSADNFSFCSSDRSALSPPT